MTTDHRAPELHPWLQGTPSHETYKARVLHKLYAEINLLTQLGDLLKLCPGLREPEKWGEQYSSDDHLRLIETGRYRDALKLITTRGR
jgi:hypothetical protein